MWFYNPQNLSRFMFIIYKLVLIFRHSRMAMDREFKLGLRLGGCTHQGLKNMSDQKPRQGWGTKNFKGEKMRKLNWCKILVPNWSSLCLRPKSLSCWFLKQEPISVQLDGVLQVEAGNWKQLVQVKSVRKGEAAIFWPDRKQSSFF